MSSTDKEIKPQLSNVHLHKFKAERNSETLL